MSCISHSPSPTLPNFAPGICLSSSSIHCLNKSFVWTKTKVLVLLRDMISQPVNVLPQPQGACNSPDLALPLLKTYLQPLFVPNEECLQSLSLRLFVQSFFGLRFHPTPVCGKSWKVRYSSLRLLRWLIETHLHCHRYIMIKGDLHPLHLFS